MRRPVLTNEQALIAETKAGSDASRLLGLAGEVDPSSARRLLAKAVKLAAANKRVSTDFSVQLAKAMTGAVYTAEDVTAVLGAAASKRVARQVFYRRYRELWVFEAPVQLVVVFDCIKGNDPYVLNVQAMSAPNP